MLGVRVSVLENAMEEKMTDTFTVPPASVSPEIVLARLDAIIRELQDLRRALLAQSSATASSTPTLTQRLSGSFAPPRAIARAIF
jgi:hypothetical protein